MKEVLLVLPDGQVISSIVEESGIRHDIRVGELIKKHFDASYEVKDSMLDNSIYASKVYKILVIMDDVRDVVSILPEIPTTQQVIYFLENFANLEKRVSVRQLKENGNFKDIPKEKLEESLRKYINYKKVITIDPYGNKLEKMEYNLEIGHDKMVYDMFENFFKRNQEELKAYNGKVIYPYAMMLSDALNYFMVFERDDKSFLFLIPQFVSQEQLDFFEQYYYSTSKDAIFVAVDKLIGSYEFIGSSFQKQYGKEQIYQIMNQKCEMKEIEKKF